MRLKALLFFTLFGYSFLLFSQNSEIDSLKNLTENAVSDTVRIDAAGILARKFRSIDLEKTFEYAEMALSMSKEIEDLQRQAGILNYIGIVHYGLGNYEQTLDYFYQVLSIHEQTQDSVQLAIIYNNVGLILTDLGRIKETIDYYKKSLKIKLSKSDHLGAANTYSNMGLAYDEIGEIDTAMYYYRLSYKIDKQENHVSGIYADLSNIGDNFMKRQNYDSAKKYYEGSMSLMNQIEEPYYKAELLEKFGNLNVAQKEYDRAKEKYTMALSMAEEIGAKQIMGNAYKGLSEAYKATGDFKGSLQYYEKYSDIQREIFNEDQARKLAQVENNFQIQTRENQISLLNKEAELKDLRLEGNQMLIYWMGGIIALIIFIIILQYRKNAYKSKTNMLLRTQNDEIKEKNKNIMDSILCAKNIQQAILPDDEKLKNVFNEAFVFSRARDVVSGDFYWFAERDEKILIAAVDCTGHGVPAAFLNVLGNTLLNQIVHESNVLSPSKILEQLNDHVIDSLKSNKVYVQVDDGMDIALCMFDRNTKKLSYAGAKRPLYFIHKSELNVVKGDHYPVGGMLYDTKRNYNQHELQLQPNDLIYMFTDGIVDQFGGESNKKFMYGRLKKLLTDIVALPLEKQKEAIENELINWQGNNEQTDDMLFIGVKV
ncbi:tetratricopeptide repeat protein [Fulvivirga sp.]|uniref:tetratricopeptide repeat protein n=1 Tax=Fulvivirga sp. TaxID=1931237 RepID=UPI0032EFEB22